ncbi:hypothetical protein V8C42DRAFT_223428 [Trichoderma barbatum]
MASGIVGITHSQLVVERNRGRRGQGLGCGSKDEAREGCLIPTIAVFGAELEATYYFGRNFVHYMLAGGVHTHSISYRKFLAYVIEKAPSLLNQVKWRDSIPLCRDTRR